MYTKDIASKFTRYNNSRDYFIENYRCLIELEKMFSETVVQFVAENIEEIKSDYNEASYLFPFWQNYPPEDRGRMPIGDQYPWIEVGERVFGSKLSGYLRQHFGVRDCGIPTGPDERFVLSSDRIRQICKITDLCWLFLDIKSVGPRDDQEHAVMSHNQVSGDGKWESVEKGVENTNIIAKGKRATHPFFCAIPPLYVLSDDTVVPVVHVTIKPVYRMINQSVSRKEGGQPLDRVVVFTIPNGILLCINPNYVDKYPGLFFPGKDDNGKDPKKKRARISFDILRKIDSWRVTEISATHPPINLF